MSGLPFPPARATVVHIEARLIAAGESNASIKRLLRQLLTSLTPDGAEGELVGAHRRAGMFGQPGAEGLEVRFDSLRQELSFVTKASPHPKRLVLRLGKLEPSRHADELMTLNAHEVTLRTRGKETFLELVPRERLASLSGRAALGDSSALAELGIATVDHYRAPVAFVRETQDWIASEGRFARVELPEASVSEPIDVIEFLDELRRAGRLPLASVEDVRRFVMAMASPLLRTELPGQLGIYWLHGPAGSGKDFLISLLREIWSLVSSPGYRTAAEIRDPKGDEDRRTLGANPDVLYVRVKEAGKKSAQVIEALIGYTGSDDLSVRRLYQDETSIPNRFTWIADSVESIPDRREISRRTVAIEVQKMSPDVVPSDVRDEILRKAPVIIASLRCAIEAGGTDTLRVASPGGRPIGAEVLASRFGARLDDVLGSALHELFDAMKEYANDDTIKKPSATFDPAKAPKLASKVPVYRTAHFVDTMTRRDGHRGYFEYIKNASWVHERVMRETDYRETVGRGGKPFLTIQSGGETFGFRFVDTKASMFIFARVDPNDEGNLIRARRRTSTFSTVVGHHDP